jgi:hypothetical protein
MTARSAKHDESFRRAAELVNDGKRHEALDIFTQLLDSDLDSFAKSMACLNMAIIHDQLGQVAQALRSYDRGIAIERTLGRYTLALRKADYCVEKDQHGDALAALGALVESGVSDMDKANACLSAATVCEKLGRTDEALEWFDRGIKHERRHSRFTVAEHKAAYLAGKDRKRESLAIYDRLVDETSMTEEDKDRIRQNIHVLRN